MMDVLNIVAVILVPILAVVVGQKLQDRAQKRNDKMQIFKKKRLIYNTILCPYLQVCVQEFLSKTY